MRSDMKKVVVERPRWGSRQRNAKFGARLRYIPGHDYEEQPKRVSISESARVRGIEKEFTDVLGPLKRFLRSRIGKPIYVSPPDMCRTVWDIFLKKIVQLGQGRHRIAFAKKQCNRAELVVVRKLLQLEQAKRTI